MGAQDVGEGGQHVGDGWRATSSTLHWKGAQGRGPRLGL